VTTTSLTETNKKIIDTFFAAGARGDIEVVQSLMADDMVLRQAKFLPYGGTYTKDQFPELAGRMSQYVDMKNASVTNVVAEGEYVFVVLSVPDLRTGHLCIQGIQIRLRDGQLVENTIFFHDAGSMAVPAP
jgi:ketosteroid isomerase-like protein